MESSLASAGGGITRYFISGATGNSYLVEENYGGNPSNYQTIYLGSTDSCGSLSGGEFYDLLEQKGCKNEEAATIVGDNTKTLCHYDIEDEQIKAMRENVIIDTVVITAPFIQIEDLRSSFQVGPDRVMLRVLPGYYPENIDELRKPGAIR